MINPRVCLAALAMCVCAPSVAQEAWPSRNVTLVVPYTPGTGADILSRVLGPKLAQQWKVAVVTDNRAGATGAIGAAHVAKSAPDGHTLLFTATSFSTTPALSPMPFDPVKSFTPVILLATGALGLVVNAEVPVKDAREFIDYVKKRPGRLNYSSPGNGGPQHLAMEFLKMETGMFIVHVPYKSAAGAMQDLLGGQVQAMVSALQTASPQVKSGKLRMLGVMSAERAKAFPDVPTLREQGIDVEVVTWYGVFAPAGTPPAVVTKINADLNALMRLDDVASLLAKQGLDPAGGTPARFGDLVRAEIPRWARVVKAANIQAD